MKILCLWWVRRQRLLEKLDTINSKNEFRNRRKFCSITTLENTKKKLVIEFENFKGTSNNEDYLLTYACRFELGLEKPNPRRALQSALTIAIAYILGGLVPLIPYMFIPRAQDAVVASVIVTLVALLIFGYAKGYFTGNKPFRSALQTALIGAIASAAAFGMAKAIHA